MGTPMNALNKSDFCYVRIAIIPGELGQESTGQVESCTNINIYVCCAILMNWNLCDYWLQPIYNLNYMAVYGESQLFLVEFLQAQINKCVPTTSLSSLTWAVMDFPQPKQLQALPTYMLLRLHKKTLT